MDNLTLRAILLFLLGGFLLFAGISIDAIGKSINNDGEGNWPFSPMVLVGGLVLTIGILMLVVAVYLAYRSYQTKKKRPMYDINPANAVRLVELPTNSSTSTVYPESRPPSRQVYQTPDIQMTTYSTGSGAANGSYLEENPYSEVQGVTAPAAAALLYHYSATHGTHHPRYSRTMGPTKHGMGMGRGRYKGGFTPLHPVEEGSESSYSSVGQMPRYATLPSGGAMENPGYSWRIHLTKEQTRPLHSSRILNDDPPPYESQVVINPRETPPPYCP